MLVSGVAPPPEAETRCNPVALPNRITPSRFHVPVGDTRLTVASPNVRGAPPAISIRFSFESAKNTIDLLSGDQVGKFPPSVPGSGRAARESSGRTQRDDAPVLLRTARMIYRPSGDAAKPPYCR